MLVTEITAQSIDEALRKQLDALNTSVESREVGTVIQIGDGIARVDGLKDAMAGELLEFVGSNGQTVYGMAQNLEEDEVGAVLLGDVTAIKENDQVKTTGRIVEIPSGKEMLGRVVNPLGMPIDGKGPIKAEGMRPVEFKAPGVIQRQPVEEPMQTGILAIDSMIPIGRGQRELIIGDRQTGKTSIAVDAIINQKGKDMICIYVAIGQKASTVAGLRLDHGQRRERARAVLVGHLDRALQQAGVQVEDVARVRFASRRAAQRQRHLAVRHGLLGQVVVDAQHVATRVVGRGRLAVLAVVHEVLADGGARHGGDVLQRSGVGRGGVHDDRVLHRAVLLQRLHQAGDVSAYIPTNVISITDGQIFLSTDLFFQGQRPAVNVGISVSRVGGSAQVKAMKQVAGTLRLDLASYRELQAFTQFGSDLDKSTQDQLNRGAHMTELLKQGRYVPMPVMDQAMSIYAGAHGYLDDIPVSDVVRFRGEFLDFIHASKPEIVEALEKAQKFTDEIETDLNAAIEAFKLQFSPSAS